MRITIPIYIQQRNDRALAAAVTVRPLFGEFAEVGASTLGRAIGKFTTDMRDHLTTLARSLHHDELVTWNRPGNVLHQQVKLRLDLRDATAELKLMMVAVFRFGKVMAFSPSLPEVWFDVPDWNQIETRALEVYENHFRELRKDDPDYRVAAHSMVGKTSIDEIVVEIAASPAAMKPSDRRRAMLGGEEVSDGAMQLRQVGRCLSWLGAENLTRPIGIDADVDRLVKLAGLGDRRAVVLVGPSGSGKTARVEGMVRDRLKRRHAGTRGLTWHLSPSRLISGMCYLGQWQQRVLAILNHANRMDHVLYFDDLLGLFEAGKTRESAACVADTIRNTLPSVPVRIVTEMTGEAWSIFRERDRNWADQFVVVPTEAMNAADSIDTLIAVRRRLEAAHHCRFDTDVIPELLSLYDRFDRTSVLPGKAIGAMNRLVRRSGAVPAELMQVGEDVAPPVKITREDVIGEFESRSGLHALVIDRTSRWDRAALLNRLRYRMVGQDEAVMTMVDRILVASARMNDTTRPLGTYLLVGPTGVGKTQLAKAVADCLFDAGGLIRLDMNELSSPSSASRLVGTFDAPDGLLTGAVRRRPHAVLLLDEIEKAHPSVLDVLLQALGEARLSDARGRTVDLSGLLILMTSNLGSRVAGRESGFGDSTSATSVAQSHLRATRDFFRPEFFNRIDGVLSFEPLSTETLERIAWMQFYEIMQRDGLQRRTVLVDIEAAAIRETARRGTDPRMGARALKRQIERDLVRPAAELLARTPTDQPMLLRLYLDETSDSSDRDSKVSTQWQTIRSEKLCETTQTLGLDELCETAERYLESLQGLISNEPVQIEVSPDGIDPKVLEIVAIRDAYRECQDRLREMTQRRSQMRLQRPSSAPLVEPGSQAIFHRRGREDFRNNLRARQAAGDIRDFFDHSLDLSTVDAADRQRDELTEPLTRLHQQLSALGRSSSCLVWIRSFGERAQPDADDPHDSGNKGLLFGAMIRWLTESEGLVCHRIANASEAIFRVDGALAMASVDEWVGGWMFIDENGGVALVEVCIREFGADPECEIDEVRGVVSEADRWVTAAMRQDVGLVRRVYRQAEAAHIDLRTGAVESGKASVSSIGRLVSASRCRIDFMTSLSDDSAGPARQPEE